MTLQKITGLAAAVTLAAGSLAMPATGLAHGSAHHMRHRCHGHAMRHTRNSRRMHRSRHEHGAPMAHIALVHGAR